MFVSQTNILLLVISLNSISFTNEYTIYRMDYFFSNKSTVNIEEFILIQLGMLEKKLIQNKFMDNDLIKLKNLMGTIIIMKKSIETPPVYWYSRQGR